MTTATEAKVLPFRAPAAFRPEPEPEDDRLQGWPLLAVWAGLVIGSWAVTIALAVLLVRGVLAVASWVGAW